MPLTESFLASIAANLATALASSAGRRARKFLRPKGRRKALEVCCLAGILAMAARLKGESPDLEEHFLNLLRDLFSDPDVGKDMVVILRGEDVDTEALLEVSVELGYDFSIFSQDLMRSAIQDFQDAFSYAASQQEELQSELLSGLALKQVALQEETLGVLKKLASKISKEEPKQATETRETPTSIVQNLYLLLSEVHISETQRENLRDERKSELREVYLKRVVEENFHLTLAGIDPDATLQQGAASRVKLNTVYTALRVRTSTVKAHTDETDAFPEKAVEDNISAVEFLDTNRRAIIIGDPGSGKSTLLDFMALSMAGEGLKMDSIGLPSMTAPLPKSNGKAGDEPQDWSHGGLLPLKIVLRDLAISGLLEDDAPGNAGDIWRFVELQLENAALSDYSEQLRTELHETGGIVLIDGLDEVPAPHRLRERLVEAVSDFSKTFSRCRFIVTTRPYAYTRSEWRLEKFAMATLQPFSDGQMQWFIRKWYDNWNRQQATPLSSDDGKAESLVWAIVRSERLKALAERPLLLTLMASLHAWRGGNLPESRSSLYREAVELLLNLWERQRQILDASGMPALRNPSITTWLQVDKNQVRLFMNKLAFETHESGDSNDEIGLIPEARIASGLLSMKKVGYARTPANPGLLIEYLRDRAGLLLPQGEGFYSFPHRSFQEYLAACYLTDEPSFPKSITELVLADPEKWREVVLLAGSKASSGAASAVWQLVESLCWKEADEENCDARDLWGARLALEILDESVDVSQLTPAYKRKLDRIRGWQFKILKDYRLPALERVAIGRSLGRLGEFRKEVLSISEMQFCLVPKGDYFAGDPDNPSRSFIPYDFWISRFPVTVAQFSYFFKNGGYDKPDYWDGAKILVRKGDNWITRPFVPGKHSPRDHGWPFSLKNHPIVGVSWYEAVAYTLWLSEVLGREVRIPFQSEWAKSARGGLIIPEEPVNHRLADITKRRTKIMTKPRENPQPRRRFSWGDTRSIEKSNYDALGLWSTSAVGCFPLGASPYGCEEMCGNAEEWCLDVAEPDIVPFGDYEEYRILRGGSWWRSGNDIPISKVSWSKGERRSDCFSFRLVMPA